MKKLFHWCDLVFYLFGVLFFLLEILNGHCQNPWHQGKVVK